MVIVAISSIILLLSQSDTMRHRWEQTLRRGDLTHREEIFPAEWQMFQERPFWGWGTIYHKYELGSRVHTDEVYQDPQNLVLWVMTETGVLGAIPFLFGVWWNPEPHGMARARHPGHPAVRDGGDHAADEHERRVDQP